MIRRLMVTSATVATGLLAVFAATPPAGAGSAPPAPPPVTCTGPGCSVSLSQFIHLSGSYSNSGGTASTPFNIPPPPCLWNPIGNATTGSQYILQQFPVVVSTDTEFNLYASWLQAKALLKNPVPGEWYYLPINPAAGQAGVKACLALPLYVWVLPGQTPPIPPVPAIDLAEYAYNHFVIKNPVVSTSPAGKGYVNLATFVWTQQPAELQVAARLGNQLVTVTAKPVSTTITASTGTAFNNCGADGSAYPVGHAPVTGPGTPPDCGVLWQTPAAGATVSATVTWRVTWGNGAGAGNNVMPAITVTGVSNPINVQEIQSINN